MGHQATQPVQGDEPTLAFAPLVFHDWKDLAGQTERRVKDAREVLYNQDERPEWVYFIEKGIVKLVRLEPDGAELILGLRSDGWLLNAAPVMLNGATNCSAVALTPCIIRRMSRAAFLQRMDSCPSFMRDVTTLTCREIRSEQEQQIQLRNRSAQNRLDRLLGEISQGSQISSPLHLMALKRLEIAQLLSITPEHLSRLCSRIPAGGGKAGRFTVRFAD